MKKHPPAPVSLADLPGGPKRGSKLADMADFPEHGGMAFSFTDGPLMVQVLIQRSNGQIKAFENRCPHAHTPLNLFGDRFLNSDGTSLICRTHGALFDPVSGLCTGGPCKGQFLRPVKIEIRGNSIYAG